MLRFHPIADARAAERYYSKSDGGYYLGADDLHREWGGIGAGLLGLAGDPDFEQFKRLIHGRDPNTGEQLTAKLVENRIPAWDITASVPKGVTTALERGDARIHEAIWQAGREAMADIEASATTRVRKGGQDDDRVTGNLVWYGVEHPETRPAKDDQMPDWDRHIHFVAFNLTHDKQEGEWKAVKFRPIMDMRKLFDRRFDLRLASKLTDLGYEIETKLKADGKGGRKYHSWDIKGIPDSVVQKFSRRTAEVDEAERRTVASIKERDAAAPDTLSPTARDKLGATSRQRKRPGMTLADYRAYWNARLTPAEAQGIAETIQRARRGQNPAPEPKAAQAVAYALQHHFERRSVVPYHELAVTAMERSLGGGLPGDIDRELSAQGVLRKGGDATTQDVLAEEGRIIAFARQGRGTCQPLGAMRDGAEPELSHLSAEQKAIVAHLWHSPDRIIMVEGDAGTGKTDAMKISIPGIDRPGVFLAPSASASRGTLRDKGFANADTIARFLTDEKFQQQARDGFIYVDEAPLAGIRQIGQLFDKARELNARVILQGDRKQHASVDRGAVFQVLQEFAGLPVARLTQIWRQKNKGYKQVVAAIAKGDVLGGYDQLQALGWVKQTAPGEHHAPLVDAYMAAIAQKKPDGKPPEILVVAPTHKEIDALTGEIRQRLQASGNLHGEERVLPQLKPVAWTEAEKGDPARYDGSEIVQFHRNSGPFRAGDRVPSPALTSSAGRLRPEHFAVYAPDDIRLAAGDTIRITANGRDKSGKHRLDNGSTYRVAGFSAGGDPVLSNGWVIAKDFGHLTHGYCTTSHASQGRTVDHVLIAMGHDSIPAIRAEQFYVSASRGRDKCTLFTDMPPAALREVIQRTDGQRSATGLMQQPKPAARKPDRMRRFVEKVRATYRQWQRRAAEAIGEPVRQREMGYGR